MRAEFLSHRGAVRENNEDAVFCDSKSGLFVVADGVGGRAAGEIASATAVRIVAEKLWDAGDAAPDMLLREAFYEANDVLRNHGREKGMEGMGTTMTAACVLDDKILIVHVGDSRAYLLNRQGIRQLTTDHSLVQQLVQNGRLTAEEAKRHPQRNILLRALGQADLVEVEEVETGWQKDDFLLLCSDGLYSLIEDEEIKEAVLRAANLRKAVDYLAELAYNRGGYDNISLILVSAEENK
ncbi:MAG: Stp1/IreP family PP2C-type Ser/Thr phosphatase [Bacillota bacterium]|nr:Stp1/IreP family PP2C-type Ser/Thr phosphatase [Bacillota bacterium]